MIHLQQTLRFCRALLGITLNCSLALTFAVCTRAQAPTGLRNPAVIPADRLQLSWWADRHKAVVKAAGSHPDTPLLLIGDSIINNYDKQQPPDESFLPTWRVFYGPRKAMNLGFSGDTTANVLWRIDHGEVNGLHPKVAILLIGTNNTSPTYNQTAEQVEAGIADLERHLPGTQILLLGILPSDISDSKTARDQAVNQYLAASSVRPSTSMAR